MVSALFDDYVEKILKKSKKKKQLDDLGIFFNTVNPAINLCKLFIYLFIHTSE
jgi:hypothetical protein